RPTTSTSTRTARSSASRRGGRLPRPRPRSAVGAIVIASTLLTGEAAVADGSETAGDVLRIALPAAAFAVTVRRDDREGRRQFYRSFAANVGATLVLKEAVDKDRPDGTDDDAFPSGH